MKKRILTVCLMSGMLMGISSICSATSWKASFVSFGWKKSKTASFQSYWTMALEEGETTSALKIMTRLGELERPARITTAFWRKKAAFIELERRFNLRSEKVKEFAWHVIRGKKRKVKRMAEEMAGRGQDGQLMLSDEELHAVMRLAIAYRQVGITRYLIGNLSPLHERFKKWERGLYGACVRIRRFAWMAPGWLLRGTAVFFGIHRPYIRYALNLADENWQREVTVTNAVKMQEVPYHQVQTGYYFRIYFGGALKHMFRD